MKFTRTLGVSLFAVAIAAMPSFAGTYSGGIWGAEMKASGTVCTLTTNPVVSAILSAPGTVNGVTYTKWSFLTEDHSGPSGALASAVVYGTFPTGNTYVPTAGDAITLTANWSPFHQIAELGTISAIGLASQGNSYSSPLTTKTIPDLNQAVLTSDVTTFLVTLSGVTVSAGADALNSDGKFGTATKSWTITDSSNNSMVFYYWPSSYSVANANLANTLVPTADVVAAHGPVSVTGFVSVYGTGATAVAEFAPLSMTPEPATLALLSLGLVLVRRRR